MGSSPRVRGEAHPSSRPRGPGRIIPAGAGRRTTSPLSPRPPPDHPRGCGEKFVMLSRSGRVAGSSPRVRGEVNSSPNGSRRAGIIPASAGRSAPSPPPTAHRRDHPRGCGEKRMSAALRIAGTGSSPRVRGEDDPAVLGEVLLGIIPAGAGRSSARTCCPPAIGDHPRGCGEKVPPSGATCSWPGSSPRVRGEAYGKLGIISAAGIIPAGAGRRRFSRNIQSIIRDHPRGCGEKMAKVKEDWPAMGSSPRVRGEAGSGV